MLAPDAAEGLADRWVLGIVRVARDATGTGDGGDTAAQGWQRVAFAGGRQIGADDVWGGRHRREPVLAAPSLEVRHMGVR